MGLSGGLRVGTEIARLKRGGMFTRRRALIAGGGAAAAAIAALPSADTADAASATFPGIFRVQVTGSGYSLVFPDGSSSRLPDPSTAVQTAVNVLSASGGTVLLEAGTYIWSAPVLLPYGLPARLRILGDGGGGDPALGERAASIRLRPDR